MLALLDSATLGLDAEFHPDDNDLGISDRRECLPHPEFPAWHPAEVFKEPARG